MNLVDKEHPQITVLMDCKGLSPFGFPMNTMRSCATLLQDHYPRRLGCLTVIRLPAVARVITQTLFQASHMLLCLSFFVMPNNVLTEKIFIISPSIVFDSSQVWDLLSVIVLAFFLYVPKKKIKSFYAYVRNILILFPTNSRFSRTTTLLSLSFTQSCSFLSLSYLQ